MSGGQIFFLSVVAVYVILIVDAAVKRVRAWRERRSNARYARAQKIPRKIRSPYRKPLIDIDRFVESVEAKIKKVSGEDPIMGERINRGSDTFFRMRQAVRDARGEGLGGFQDLWSQSIHKPRKRARLSDVLKPADPGDRPLKPKPKP